MPWRPGPRRRDARPRAHRPRCDERRGRALQGVPGSTGSSRSSGSRPTWSTTAPRPQATRYERNHLTLIAANEAGFREPGQAQLGRLPRGVLARQGERRHGAALAHSEGVIALTGCLQSRFCRRLVEDRPDDARAHIDDLIQAFGPEQVYFELQRNGIAEQDKANEGIVRTPASSAGRWWQPPTSTTCAARTTTTTRRCSACRRSRRWSSRSSASTPTSSI